MAFISSTTMRQAVAASGPVYGPFPNYSGPDVGSFDMGYQGGRGAARARMAGVNARLGQSFLGRAVRQGTLESFGWQFDSAGNSYGFMGKVPDEGFGVSSKAKMNSAIKNSMKGATRPPGILGKTGSFLGRGLGLGFTGFMAYQGYKQEGVWGAAKGIAESVAGSVAFRIVTRSLGLARGSLLTGPAILLGVGLATYAVGEAGREHAKSLRAMEMGGGVQMQQAVGSQGAYTSRAMAVTALNNSHINNRMALGNEAFLMHRSFA